MIWYGIRGTAATNSARAVRTVIRFYEACERYNVKFTFGQTGNIFVQDGVEKKIHNRTEHAVEALRTGFTYPPVDIEHEIQMIYDEKAAKKAAFEDRHKKSE